MWEQSSKGCVARTQWLSTYACLALQYDAPGCSRRTTAWLRSPCAVIFYTTMHGVRARAVFVPARAHFVLASPRSWAILVAGPQRKPRVPKENVSVGGVHVFF